MKFPVVKRGVLLAVCTGNPEVFIRTFPPMADQHNNRTGSPLHQPESKLGTGKLDRKVVVKPQTSTKSQPRVSRSINDNYFVLSVAGVKNSVHVSGKKQVLNPSPVINKSETSFTCKLFCCKCSFCHRVATKERCKSQLLCPPTGGWTYYFCFFRHPDISRHFRQQFLSYLYQIWHAGLLG